MRLPRSVICVHRRFERSWPYTADHWQRRWQASGGCELIRTGAEDAAPARLVPDPASVQRLVLLGFSLGAHDLDPSPLWRSATWIGRTAPRTAVAAAERAA